jgi:cystathionine beta-lyase
MKYNFDKEISRYGTNSLKYDFPIRRGMPEGLLPMWVADMDFPAPPEVLDRLQSVVSHGIFGYTEADDGYYAAVADWFSDRFGYGVKREETVKVPGVVYALAMAVRAFTEPGDGVIIQTPVYYPFYSVIRDNGREVTENPLICKNNEYTIDFDDFERKAAASKLFILCSPHNPVGRVWKKSELETLCEICGRHGVTVVSDEIHCDFVFADRPHTVFGGLSEDAVVCTAPTKTFNLAGVQVANVFIKNERLRRKFLLEINRSGYSQLNAFAIAACESAYTQGGEWLRELKAYLAANIAFVREFLSSKLPFVKLVEPEGTYLLWLDFRALKLTQRELDEQITRKAKLWLDTGTMFGSGGEGFQRINVACPKTVLNLALERLFETFFRTEL